ncbi:MAG: hypothetical protein BA874_05620 [Desulfuromonadales bacterium C00003068]|jgi:hypothetical protein|nr:MAG: hypothetical protein BA874_05620 [Desulfuromonadales bacterium C00003068]
MARSFQLVDQKVAEADFFLGKLLDCGFNLFEFRCYLSAFAASARSITFSLQSVLRDETEFNTWYETYQVEFKKDKLAKFFNDFRRITQHVGEDSYGGGGMSSDGKARHFFMPTKDLPNVPEGEIGTACMDYLKQIIQLIYDCYLKFGPSIDAHQYFTEENFRKSNRTIEDAEEELGFPCGWTDVSDPDSTPYRWQALRDTVTGCEINHIFKKHLNKEAPCTERLPEYVDKREYKNKNGWLTI